MTAPITVLLKGIVCTLSLECSVFPFQLVATSETARFPLDLRLVRRESDTVIVCGEDQLQFKDAVTCALLWSVMQSPQPLFPTPSADHIEWIAAYLASAHPILRPLIVANVNLAFVKGLYEVFSAAEMGQRWNVLRACNRIMMSLLLLESPAVLSLLLSPSNVYHTIACLEYSQGEGQGQGEFRTAHRRYVDQSKFRCVLPLLHDRIKPFAYTHFCISYLKCAILGPSYLSLYPSIDSLLLQNNHELLHILFSEKTFAKQVVRELVPVMVSVNQHLVCVARPNAQVFGFLKELFSLPVSESAMKRLLRKLEEADLFSIIDYLYASPQPFHKEIMELWCSLVRKDTSYAHFNGALTSIIGRLTSSDPIDEIDLSIEFLQQLIPTSTEIDGHLPHLIRSAGRMTCFEKKQKLHELIGWIFQTRPDLCRVHVNACVGLFMQQAERMLIDATMQQKLLTISSSSILGHAVSHAGSSVLYRTGMMESMLTALLVNGRDNAMSASLHGVIHRMVTHWIHAFLASRPNLSMDKAIYAFQQLSVVVTSAMRSIGNTSLVGPRAPRLIRYDSVEICAPRVRESAVQRMVHAVQNCVDRMRRQAWNRWVAAGRSGPDTFMMEAVYVMAVQRAQMIHRMIGYAVKVSLGPLIRRIQLRGALQKWKAAKAHGDQLREYIRLYGGNRAQPNTSDTDSSFDSRSSGQITRVPSYSDFHPLLHRNSSIGEVLCGARDDDHFYTISHIKKEGLRG
jgi:hypothetical protein